MDHIARTTNGNFAKCESSIISSCLSNFPTTSHNQAILRKEKFFAKFIARIIDYEIFIAIIGFV